MKRCKKCDRVLERAWKDSDFWQDMDGFQSCSEGGTHEPKEQ